MPGKGSAERAAARRRHYEAVKRRVAERPRGDCPTPSKPAYDRTNAEEAKLQDWRLPLGGSAYDCPCGFSHNTTNRETPR